VKPDTKYSGECQHCRKWMTYTPLPRGHAPGLAQMGVTCSRCGEPAVIFAHEGQSIRQPLILDSRDELDLAELNAHIREHHAGGRSRIRGHSAPRKLSERAAWHWGQHHRLHQAHHHFGPFVLIKDRHGSTVGQIARPLGWYTGQEVKTRAELAAEWKAAHPA
jgi:hypothetical protein